MEPLPGIRPRPSLSRQLDRVARQCFPAVTTMLLLLAAGMPIALPGRAALQAGLALACVFFWSVYRPVAMPPVAVFLIGLMLDLLGFTPLGVGPAMLLACHGAARLWRRELIRHGFVALWLAFVAVSAGASTLGWALVCVLDLRLYPPAPGVLQALLAAGMFPVMALLLTRAHLTLAEPGRA